MDRRTLLKSVAVGATVGVGAGAAAARVFASEPNATTAVTTVGPRAPMANRGVKRLSMVTTWPKNLPGLGEAAERLGRLIGALTSGSLEVRVYAGGEIVPPFEAFDAVSTGYADMYHGAEYYWQGKSSAYPFFTAVPFGLSAQEHMAWIDWGGGQALWDELSSQFDVVPMQAANTGVQMGGWYKREVSSLADMRGLKVRMPGLGGEVIRALGGAAVAIPGGEIYGALQSGLIDATEWVGPWNDFFLGFYREAPFYYGPGFHEPGASLACGINRRVWEGLTSQEQAAIKTACQAVNHQSLGEFHQQNAAYLDVLLREHGVQLRRFPDDVIKAAAEAAKDVNAKAGASDGLARRIYESFERHRKKLAVWSASAEGGYYDMRRIAG